MSLINGGHGLRIGFWGVLDGFFARVLGGFRVKNSLTKRSFIEKSINLDYLDPVMVRQLSKKELEDLEAQAKELGDSGVDL